MSDPREPIFNLEPLTNSDTVITWLTRTNELVNSLNSLYLADVYQGNGINLTRSADIVTIDIDPGPGMGFTAGKALTLNFNNLTTLSFPSATTSSVADTDHVILSKNNTLFKVEVSKILPTTIYHQHTFDEQITFSKNIKTIGISLQDEDNSDNSFEGGEITFSYQNANGYPNGINLKTSSVDSGINVSPEAFIRNYYPEFITKTDDVSRANTDYVGEGTTSTDTFFTTANFNFATTTYPDSGDPNLVDGALRQNAVSLNFYTGTEGNDGGLPHVGNPDSLGSSSLRWPMKWSLVFGENYYAVKATEGFRGGDGTLNSYEALKYTYNENSSLGLFQITGKISISNIQGSSQFTSTPNGINKVPLTDTNGLLNKKFVNRISTLNYTSLSVGDIVYAGTLTDGVIWYKKARAHSTGNYDTIGIVESIEAGGNAVIVLNGEFELSSGSPNLEPGVKYYLSQDSEGDYVAEGTYTTGILKPVFVATSETKGILVDAIVDVSSISSVSIYNISDASSDSLTVDSPDYDLNLVGGNYIRLDINSENEIEISVDGLAGSQSTFKSIQVDGVGATDGDHFVIADSADDNVKFVSTTLKITADDTTKEIFFEAPNAFTQYKFTDAATDLIYEADTQYDTLHFIAGTGINFTQNTDDSIIITATVEGGVNPNNLVFTGPYQMIVSDDSGTGSLVSLEGGDGDYFFENLSYTPINTNLDSSKTITRAGAVFTYDGVPYTLPGEFNPAFYLPDELAGYMIGRITPPTDAAGTETQPDTQIRRLSRKDVRAFLGIALDGFIDEITNIFNNWSLYAEDGSTVGEATAASKDGSLIFKAGTGIELEEIDVSGSPAIRITNTGTFQNAFASVAIKTYDGAIIDTYDANNSADTFTLKSGRFVRISTDTNADTAEFDIDIEDDYVILGNAGSSDGMGVISLQDEPYSLVGRAAGAIRPIVFEDFKWSEENQPTLQLPFYGLVSAGGILLNAGVGGENTGRLNLSAGEFIQFVVNETTNTIEINGTGDGTAIDRLTTVYVNDTPWSLGDKTGGNLINKIKFQESSLINLTALRGTSDPTVLEIGIGLDTFLPNTVLVNMSPLPGPPEQLTIAENSILARRTGQNLDSLKITSANSATAETTLRTTLGIPCIKQLNRLLNVGNFTTNPVLGGFIFTPAGSNTFTQLPGATFSGGNPNYTNDTQIVLLNGYNTSVSTGRFKTSSTAAESPAFAIHALTSLYTDNNCAFRPTYGFSGYTSADGTDRPIFYRKKHGIGALEIESNGIESYPNPLYSAYNSAGELLPITPYFKINKTGIVESTALLCKTDSSGVGIIGKDFVYKEIYFNPDPSTEHITPEHIGSVGSSTPTKLLNLTNINNVNETSSYIYCGPVNVPGLEEYVYAAHYKTSYWNIKDDQPSKWTVRTKDLILDSSGEIALGDATNSPAGYLNLYGKKISAINNMISFNTSTGSPINLIAFTDKSAGAAPVTSDTADVPMKFFALNEIHFSLEGSVNSSTSWLNITRNTSNDAKVITTNAATKIVIDCDVDFAVSGGTLRNINFTNCNITGTTVSAHRSTHTSTNSVAVNGSGPQDSSTPEGDEIQAWMVGAVSRNKPTLRNGIYITNADGNFDQNFISSGYESKLFSGTDTFNTTNYGSITTTQYGPLYIVVPAGTDPTTGSGAAVNGPPGQIIFVKKT
jgi:hypothetical protein